MAKIIDGKTIAAAVRAGIAGETAELKRRGVTPGLAVVLVGDDPASRIYVNSKERACGEVGFYSEKHLLPAGASMEELLELINRLNNDPRINGILCQLPLPAGLNADEVIRAVNPAKDVDAFHPVNVGKIMLGTAELLPCTPAGIMKMLDYENISVEGKNCVVVGRSNIVGKPMAMLLMHKNGTVTVCHSRTRDLAEHCRRADILVAAVGKPRFITGDMIKPGAVVIDVGMNRPEGGGLCGDVDFESAKEKAAYITPVPGGVGPMTIAMLLRNTLEAAKKQAAV